MSKLCVFTANATPLLIQSGERVGITVHSYSPNPWKDFVNGKIREGVKFLADRTEEFAMWVDGADTLMLQPEDEILARLGVYGFNTVVSAEKTCWPDATLAERFPVGIKGPQYINTGGYIGLRSHLMSTLHCLAQNANGHGDDQLIWTQCYLAGLLDGVQIDYARRLFSSIGDGDEALRADSCVYHWNGRVVGREEYWEGIK